MPDVLVAHDEPHIAVLEVEVTENLSICDLTRKEHFSPT